MTTNREVSASMFKVVAAAKKPQSKSVPTMANGGF